MVATGIKLTLFAAVCGLAVSTSGCFRMSSPDAHNEDVVVCRDEAPTGSHIARTKCVRRAQIEERGENDREQMRRIQHSSAIRPSNGQ